jgi:outer membrane protein OmpA-like peptidoglycan-associated protein
MIRYRIILFILLCGNTGFSQEKRTDSLLIHFEFNRSAITPQAAVTLDSLLQSIAPARLLQIQLYGHCDFIGSHAYNDALSLQRVQATKEWLTGKGIDAAAFTQAAGFGKRQPIDASATDIARAANRRVAILFEWQAVAPRVERPATPSIPTGPSIRLNDRGGATPDISKIIADPAIKAGSKLTLPNLYFEGGRHYLMPQSYPVLKGLLQAMQDMPQLAIEVQGHICCEENSIDGMDSDLLTRDLSVQRAKMIYQYLVENGIDESRLSYRGFGSSQKVFRNERTPEEQMKNRRVEIRIIRK